MVRALPLLQLDPAICIDPGAIAIGRLRFPVIKTPALMALYAMIIDASAHRVPILYKIICINSIANMSDACLTWLQEHAPPQASPYVYADGSRFRVSPNGIVEGWADFMADLSSSVTRLWDSLMATGHTSLGFYLK